MSVSDSDASNEFVLIETEEVEVEKPRKSKSKKSKHRVKDDHQEQHQEEQEDKNKDKDNSRSSSPPTHQQEENEVVHPPHLKSSVSIDIQHPSSSSAASNKEDDEISKSPVDPSSLRTSSSPHPIGGTLSNSFNAKLSLKHSGLSNSYNASINDEDSTAANSYANSNANSNAASSAAEDNSIAEDDNNNVAPSPLVNGGSSANSAASTNDIPSSPSLEHSYTTSTTSTTTSSSKPPVPIRTPSSREGSTSTSSISTSSKKDNPRYSVSYKNEIILTQLAGLTDDQIKEHYATQGHGKVSEPVGFLAFCDPNAPSTTVQTAPSSPPSASPSPKAADAEQKKEKKGWGLFSRKKNKDTKETKPDKSKTSTKQPAVVTAAAVASPSAGRTASPVRAVSPTPGAGTGAGTGSAPSSGAGTATTTTEEKLKATEDEPPKEKQTFVVSTIEELPDDCKKLIKQSGLTEDVMVPNFNILLNVLHFRTGKILKTPQNVGDPPYPPLPKTTRFAEGASKVTPLPDLKKTYKELKEAGHGGFGTVFHAKSNLHKGKVVAVKKMPHKTKKQKTSNYHEIAVLSSCSHPNVVKYMASHEVGEELWVVMEFLEGGTFEEAAKACRFSEANLAYVARELLKGISYLHQNEIAHRDLKSANIMMGIRGEVKMIDFGLCCDMSVGNPKHMVGSPFWMPPEMIKCKPHDYAVDIWSFAISLLEMANQKPPMIESAVKAMFTVGTDGVTQFFLEPERWSVTFKDFLNRCLRLDPAERSPAEELLQHPFIKMADSRTNMESLLRRIFLRDSLMNSGF